MPKRLAGSRFAALLAVAAAAGLSVLTAGLAAAQVASPPAPAVAASFYFFSPDWRPADLGKLAVSTERAFAAGGVQIRFQGFTRYEDFEREMLAAPADFVLAPGWLGGHGAAAVGVTLVPIVHPVRRGKTVYRKALMTRPGIDSIDDLTRGSVAATLHSMGPGTATVVLEAFHLAPDSAKIVPVPKDVDALLALSFGQVDAALVTSEQFEQLSRGNPREAERLRVLAFSPEVTLPPVFARDAVDRTLGLRVRDLLVRLPELAEGPAVLQMLGFDAFVAELPKPPTESVTPAAPAAPPQAAAAPPKTATPKPKARAKTPTKKP
jgi:hypothetical protein